MDTFTLKLLSRKDDPYKNCYGDEVNKTRTASVIRELTKSKKKNTYATINVIHLKLWKADVFILKSNEKLNNQKSLKMERKVNLEHKTLKDFREFIYSVCKIPNLEDSAVFTAIIEDSSITIQQFFRVFQEYQCDCVDIKDKKYKESLFKLFDELETRFVTTPIDLSCEMTKKIYSYSYLPRATFQMESSKRKADEINDNNSSDKVWGIVTNSKNENMRDQVEKALMWCGY
ncbi:hypothetical protein Glove_183g69 [Diversispora epigaea]|uniref:Uncharacterized protein n=1 Tax=Diversispora epigaea TaxID=1348612 RepID=A0A397IQN1_9GLOM|nr:hypothetical protein Glove_183g69 [Diversispora epigaea]